MQRTTSLSMSAEELQAYRTSFRARQQQQFAEREAMREAALHAARERIPPLLTRWPGIQRAYLFGSVLRPGAFHRRSDIDIAIEGVPGACYFEVWQVLEAALPEWFIDLRDMEAAPLLADLIQQTGELLYERSPTPVTS